MKVLIILIFSLFSIILKGQNHIQNGGFEDLIRCLDSLCGEQITGYQTQAVHWFNGVSNSSNVFYNSTCDIYSRCNQLNDTNLPANCNLFGVPRGWQKSYQEPFQGNNFSGLGFGNYFISNLKLTSPYTTESLTNEIIDLYSGKKYCIEAKINVAPRNIHLSSKYFCNVLALKKIDVLLTTKSPPFNGEGFIELNPSFQIYNDSATYLNDSTNWDKIYNYFEADSAYEYMTIGNIHNGNNIIDVELFTNVYGDSLRYIIFEDYFNNVLSSYYFFDDFQLYEINDISITTTQTQLYLNQSTWLYASNKPDAIEWFANDTLTSIGLLDSILVQPLQTTTYYVKSLQCRYTSWDTITIEVLPEPLIPVEVKIINNLSEQAFNIQYTGDLRPPLTAKLFNAVGQIVKTLTFVESVEVPIEDLASGVYFCRISSQGIPILTERVMKVR